MVCARLLIPPVYFKRLFESVANGIAVGLEAHGGLFMNRMHSCMQICCAAVGLK